MKSKYMNSLFKLSVDHDQFIKMMMMMIQRIDWEILKRPSAINKLLMFALIWVCYSYNDAHESFYKFIERMLFSKLNALNKVFCHPNHVYSSAHTKFINTRQ